MANMIPSPGLSDWCRILLLIASFVSFLPQIRLLLARRDSSGISLLYVLVNLINATEQFTLAFGYLAILTEDSGYPRFSPPTLGDWIHLGRITLVWGLWLVVFALTLGFLPGRRISLLATVATYLIFLVVSVIPEVVAKLLGPELDSGDPFMIELFLLMHLAGFTPVIALLCLPCGMFVQATEVASRPPRFPSPPLSKTGLWLQAVVFGIVAILWLVELPSPPGRLDQLYILLRWFAVSDGAFAAGQALLFLVAFGGRVGDQIVTASEAVFGWLVSLGRRIEDWLVSLGRRIEGYMAASSGETEPLLDRRGEVAHPDLEGERSAVEGSPQV